jgi:predicted nucleic acid-binding protein
MTKAEEPQFIVLELVVIGRADVIVSGDADLLVIVAFRDIPILTPTVCAHAQAF